MSLIRDRNIPSLIRDQNISSLIKDYIFSNQKFPSLKSSHIRDGKIPSLFLLRDENFVSILSIYTKNFY